MLADANVVILVAGVGSGACSGVAPIMANPVREAGALTVADVVTPFEWEGVRNRTADTAIRYLEREVDLVVQFSNQELAEVLSDDSTLDDAFTSQDQRTAVCLRGLMDE